MVSFTSAAISRALLNGWKRTDSQISILQSMLSAGRLGRWTWVLLNHSSATRRCKPIVPKNEVQPLGYLADVDVEISLGFDGAVL